MFTGIVEEKGSVLRIESAGAGKRLMIRAKKVLEGLKLGDSIATNGVCLTVTDFDSEVFGVDVMPETMRQSNLGALRPGSEVNLERALTLETRLGGHIVSGHIDGMGRIRSFKREDNAIWLTVETAPELLRYMIDRGSVAVDGVSLTIARLDTDSFAVSLIPLTAAETTLLTKREGDYLNLECDLIGKYVERLLGLDGKSINNNINNSNTKGLSMEKLAQAGFL